MTLIVDLLLHEKAKLNRGEFLERVRPVVAIRTNQNRREEVLTLYIHSLRTFMLLRHLRDAIVQGDFDGLNGYYGCYHAAVEISEPLDLWFRNTDNDTILRQIICWLAALYRFNPDSQSIKEEQLYPPVFQEVRQVASEFFAFEKDPYTLEVDEEISIYHDAALAYYGSIPPKLLVPCATTLALAVEF